MRENDHDEGKDDDDEDFPPRPFDDAGEAKSMDDDATMGSGGLMKNSAASRARVLQQQREMAMKRRQNQMNSGMMMRSDGPRASNLMSGMDSQTTPAMRQFSAPKKAIDSDKESEDEGVDNEWDDPNKKKNVKSDFMR